MNITLATLGNFTEQQVFEKVATHLLTQNAKSYGSGLESDACKYRGEDGKMCAAGCLIAYDEYSSSMEGTNWTADIFPDTHKDLIVLLQAIHDIDEVEDWYEKLEELAFSHNLDSSFMLKFK